jgi:hypothetical protein
LTGSGCTSARVFSNFGAEITALGLLRTVFFGAVAATLRTGLAAFLEAVFPLVGEVFAVTAFLPFETESVIFVLFFGCIFLAVNFLTAFTTFFTAAVAFFTGVFFAVDFFVVFCFLVSAIRSSFM